MDYRNQISPNYVIFLLLPLICTWGVSLFYFDINLSNMIIIVGVSVLVYSPALILVLCFKTRLTEDGLWILYVWKIGEFIPFTSIREISVTDKGFSYFSLSDKKIRIVWEKHDKKRVLLVSPKKFDAYYDLLLLNSRNAVTKT